MYSMFISQFLVDAPVLLIFLLRLTTPFPLQAQLHSSSCAGAYILHLSPFFHASLSPSFSLLL